ncbi:hypothetical protein BOX15_Mlig014357g1 [Macrostomum lignano]|uniref:Uncharacterized protein n=1 Tax=Macrostomum lignano TaxID=282301 RepID=A0A267DPR0_9PLAT|nr:hypothetical protein BOX15_Mlig006106g1 [Macrostomum lignano]PAA94086.1 hypothetical protein BOX15_Mlig014357g1 [Macrostomum lignano]
MRRSRHQLSSSLRAPWPGSLTPSLAARLCLLACAFVATAAAAASASKAAANSDAFLAAVLSLGPAPGQRPIINRAKRRSPPSPVELAPQLIDSLGLCPGDSDSVALAARLEALSAAWLRVRHCPHLPLATVLPMFPGQPGAEPLPGSAGNAFDTTKKFEFDAGVPPSGCSALLLGPAEATRALLLAASSTSGATTPAAVAASSSASPTASSSSGLVYNSSSFGGASLSSFIEDSPLLQPPLASSLAPSLTGALNLSRLLCQCARAVADRSDQLRAVSNHFGGLLNQMYFKAKSAHSQEHIESLKQCQIAYTDWLCSVYFTVHNTSREAWTVQAARGRFAEAAASALMQPCPDWCQAVETECPYLSPSEEMSNAGEPLFLCHEDSYKGAGFTDRCRESDCCCYKPTGPNRSEIRFTGCKLLAPPPPPPAPAIQDVDNDTANFTVGNATAGSGRLVASSRWCPLLPPMLNLLLILLTVTATGLPGDSFL